MRKVPVYFTISLATYRSLSEDFLLNSFVVTHEIRSVIIYEQFKIMLKSDLIFCCPIICDKFQIDDVECEN